MLTVCRSLIWHTGIAERWFLTSIKNTYETSLLKTSLPGPQLIPVGVAIFVISESVFGQEEGDVLLLYGADSGLKKWMG